jgi:hypothetical protein
MTTPLARVFGVSIPVGQKTHQMAGNRANQRMLDLGETSLRLQKGMSAAARILHEALAFAYRPHAMTKQAAPVPRPLDKTASRFKRIVPGRNQKLMAAAVTDVFVQQIPVGEANKLMTAEKTGEDMPDVRMRSVFSDARFDTLATHGIGSLMPEYGTGQFRPIRAASGWNRDRNRFHSHHRLRSSH